MTPAPIPLRDITSLDDCRGVVSVQESVWGRDGETVPASVLFVSAKRGGILIGGYRGTELVGFVWSLRGVRDGQATHWSHMLGVTPDARHQGLAERLKWAQRERALGEGRKLIKWTWEPMLARNAHFNLNRLGATVENYFEDFYGVDYGTDGRLGLASDRLSAEWRIDSDRVHALAKGNEAPFAGKRVSTIAVPADWNALVKRDAQRAREEQMRVREEFKRAFADRLICAGLERGEEQSRYILFEPNI